MSRKTELTEQHWHKGKIKANDSTGIDWVGYEIYLRATAADYRAKGNLKAASQFKRWAQYCRG